MKTAIKACKKVKGKKDTFCTGGIGGSSYFEFELGKIYELPNPENLKLCAYGFHYFRKEDLCFGIDFFEKETVFVEIEILGNEISDTFKRCTNKIKILNYIPKKIWKKSIKKNNNSGNQNSGDNNSGKNNSGYYNSGNSNSGDNNSGHDNSGNCNSGNHNSGYDNSGHHNSGNWNSGNKNSGNKNSGNWNSGYDNSGYHNSGNVNSGNVNSGDYNSGNSNSGKNNSGNWNSGNSNSGNNNSGNWNSGNGYFNKFCTKQKFFLFDKEVSKETYNKIQVTTSWFSLERKTYKEAWACCPKEVLQIIKKTKEFKSKLGKSKFLEITGINLDSIT